jgi:DNA-binding NtrC family response regulator
MPPLRDRPEDIPVLAQHFFHAFRQEFRKPLNGLSRPALSKLQAYAWPGNVRELRNVMERAVLLCEGADVEAADIVLGRVAYNTPRDGIADALALPLEGCTFAQVEESVLRQALRRARWNYSQAGRMLDLSRDQVRYKAEKYGLRPDA